MPLVIHCPNCSKRYQVADTTVGKRVRCQQCGNTFTAEVAAASPSPVPRAASDPLDSLAGADLSQWTASAPLHDGASPAGASAYATTGYAPAARQAKNAGVSNPSGGPTDAQMRLVCGGMLAFGILLCVGTLVLQAVSGVVYLFVVGLAPLMLVLGIAGLISPNVARGPGQYGGHLPAQYKVIGWGLIGLSFLLMILLFIGLFVAGFQPDRPGGRKRTPSLTRSQTATVLQRIRESYEASADADVVRTVSFPVFAVKKPNPAEEAERVLGPVPGYVAGSFQLSADQKTLTFQFKGDKAMAGQYAVLLPGPTGLYIRLFNPEFTE